MEEFSASCALAVRENVRHLAVVVPFNVFDVAVSENVGHCVDNIFNNLRVCKVKHKLISALRRLVNIGLYCPVGVRSVKIRVGRDHFRLYPETELETHFINFFGKAVNSGRKLLFVYVPVAERRFVVVALSEPAVIKDEHFAADFLCCFCNVKNFLLVEVEVCGLPVVDKNGTLLVFPVSSDNVLLNKSMHIAAHSVKTFVAEGEDAFGRVKAPVGSKQPFKLKRIDTVLYSQKSVRGNLGLCNVVA